jgi:hypothetical protein
LEVVELSGCASSLLNANLLAQLVVRNKKISRLEVSHFNNFTHFNTQTMVDSFCGQIKVLSFSHCSELPLSGLKLLCLQCHLLTKLTFSDTNSTFTDELLVLLSENCKELKNLFFYENILQFTDVGIVALAKGCSKLTELIFDNAQFGCVGLVAIGKHLTHLQRLYVRNNMHITDLCLTQFAEEQKCEKLEIISLADCTSVTSDGFLIVILKIFKTETITSDFKWDFHTLFINKNQMDDVLHEKLRKLYPKLRINRLNAEGFL